MKLLWLDFETTGLDPERDAILEIGIVEADFLDPFTALSRYSVALHYSKQGEYELRQMVGVSPPHMVAASKGDGYGQLVTCMTHHANGYMSDVVYKMHKESGLWDECDRSIHLLWQVENYLVSKYGEFMLLPEDEKPILAGSSVHFDHSFIKRHMPKFNEVLSYRHYDTRTIQLFCRSLGMPKIPKKLAHRALDDIDEAMSCGRECVAWLTKQQFTGVE